MQNSKHYNLEKSHKYPPSTKMLLGINHFSNGHFNVIFTSYMTH
jgi:hypothetical protein